MTLPLIDTPNLSTALKQFSFQELEQLAQEIRLFLIETVAKTGGHLGSNLGVVELTLALHFVLNLPQDKLIWDVSHQSYVHKILTQRKHLFNSLRQKNGLSGFAHIQESNYDCFGAGHSSTSLSAAVGFALSSPNKVVAVMGDGALSAGMAYEAMNHLGELQLPCLFIINDNDMSISPPTGAMRQVLQQIDNSKLLKTAKHLAKLPSEVIPPLHHIGKNIKKIGQQIASNLQPDSQQNFFEHLGFDYYGVIDGHDLRSLIPQLQLLTSKLTKPTVLHIKTEKGKGYSFAEKSESKYHGVGSFNTETGIVPTPTSSISYSQLMSQCLTQMHKNNGNIVAITAAMLSGTGLDYFKRLYPQDCLDVGIAEQHAVTMAASMGLGDNKIPFVCIYSTFLQRAYDQIVHDVVLQNANVKFCIDRAGYVGNDGATHQGAFDVSYLGCLPTIQLIAPSNAEDFVAGLWFMYQQKGPMAIRYPRLEVDAKTAENLCELIGNKQPPAYHDYRLIQAYNQYSKKLIVLNSGFRLKALQEALSQLQATLPFTVELYTVNTIKPVPKGLIDLLLKADAYITLNDGALGGFGAIIDSALQPFVGLNSYKPRLHLHLPDMFMEHATIHEQYALAKLDTNGLIEQIQRFINL